MTNKISTLKSYSWKFERELMKNEEARFPVSNFKVFEELYMLFYNSALSPFGPLD